MESGKCPNCGAPAKDEKCEYCGARIFVASTESARPAPAAEVWQRPVELWNPTAAIWWSLLFLPLGPIIHHLNWKALGEYEKAKNVKSTAIGFCIIVFIMFLIPEELIPSYIIGSGMFFGWVAWSWGWLVNTKKYITGKEQVGYIAEKYGIGYERKSLLVPLIIALGIWSLLLIIYVLIYE